MIKLFKYLKSSIISIFVIILLLIAQAALDLQLPKYTSKIINVGIQQNGIENAASNLITEKTYNLLPFIMNDEDKIKLDECYELIEKGDSRYSKKYPLVKSENIYLLKKDKKNKANELLKKPFMLIYSLTHMDTKEFNVPEGINLLDMITMMDDNQVKNILDEFDEKTEKLPDTSLTSLAILQVKEEYKHAGIDLEKFQINYIAIAGIKMLSIALLIMIVSILIVFFGSRLAARLAKTLRSKVYKKVVYFSKNEMKQFGTSSLITRTTNDIQQIQQVVVMLMRVVFYAPIIAIGGIIKTYNSGATMLFIVGFAILSLIVIMGSLFIFVMPKFTKLQVLTDKLNQVSREILTGIPVIRAFANEKHEEERFDVANNSLTKVNLFVNRTMSIMMPMMMLIMNVVCITIVWVGAYGVDDGSIQVGDIMACIQYAMQIIFAFLMISMVSIILPRANVSAKRVIEIIDTENTVKDPVKTKKLLPDKKGVVEFKNVCFRYPDAFEDVITDVSFKSVPGTTTAFIGSTGSGKSTLINLIPRFYDVTEGSIEIDGVDIREIEKHTLRDKIGYVPQKGILFSGTIKSNIKYANNNISDKDMELASEISQSKEFINKLNKKYDSEITQGGTNVSGGQRQRLSIARAIASNPDILIFDDSFSALDFKTDAKLRKDLKKVTKDKTVFIVAQRISTIMNADTIVVLDEGKVAGIGSHDELMKSCDVYKEIALSQLSKEELENA